MAGDPVMRGAGAVLAHQVWAVIGAEYFQALTKQLSDALGADLAYVGELCFRPAKRVDALSACRGGSPADLFNYELAGTPAAEALAGGVSIHRRKARQAFPSDPTLQMVDAEAFAAKGLFDSAGQPLGIIALAWRRPPADIEQAVTMLEAFAARTAHELERKRHDDRLRESEQRYHAFISENTDAMWRVEFEPPIPVDLPEDEQIVRIFRDGYLAECNEAMVRMLGRRSAAELIGVRVSEIVPGDNEEIGIVRRMVRTNYKSFSFELRTRDAQGNVQYRLRNYLGIVENGQLVRSWGISRDIGELRKAEFEWQASEQRFRQLLETIRLAAVLTDIEGRVLFCNDFVHGLTGWPKGELIGKNVFELLIPEENRAGMKAAFQDAVSGGQPHQYIRSPLLRRDGARRLMDWDTTVLRDAAGRIAAAAAIGRDITEQAALEARLREAEKLEGMGKLAGAIAHDFNNVLTIIRGYAAELAAAQVSGSLRTAVKEIVHASEVGSDLARRLVAFSHEQPVQAAPKDLNDGVRENENLLRSLLGGKIELVTDLDPAAGTVPAGAGQIHRVLVNLTLNARDAMPNGGKLTITTQALDAGERGAEGMPEAPAGRYAMLSVADTGVGMTKEVRAHLFEPFFTTKAEGGTGLGLPSVYGIVRGCGGHISVESEPGKGTAVRILFPALPAPQPAPPRAETAPAGGMAAGTVLLVEDQAALRALVAKALESSGCEVLEAATGEDALSLVERHRGPIDLLLTDIGLPGIGGTELAGRLRAARPGLKVLFTSGLAEGPPGEACVQKPFTMRELKVKIRELLKPGA